jgi:hypothetical protein
MPHVNVLRVFDEKKDVRTSAAPAAGTPPSASGGRDTNGTITRVIRFIVGVSENGGGTTLG